MLVRVKKYRSYRGTVNKIAPNILARHFQADLDLFNGEIITYTVGLRPVYSSQRCFIRRSTV